LQKSDERRVFAHRECRLRKSGKKYEFPYHPAVPASGVA